MKYSRSDPRVIYVLAVGAVAMMIFGGVQGLVGGVGILWFFAIIIVPGLWMEGLRRQFGPLLGVIIALAPIWLLLAIGLGSLLIR